VDQSQETIPTEPQNQTTPEELQKQLAELHEQLKEKDNKYLYLYADFENFKKRTIKERSDLLKYGWEPQARELLQVVDNLERALKHAPASTEKTLLEGLQLVTSQIKSTLEKHGVRPLEALQRSFDPNLHEAVGQEPSDQPAGTIIQEHSSGYLLNGRLLRPARVIISAGKSAPEGVVKEKTAQ
jgi:molecular chaperone GrpE